MYLKFFDKKPYFDEFFQDLLTSQKVLGQKDRF